MILQLSRLIVCSSMNNMTRSMIGGSVRLLADDRAEADQVTITNNSLGLTRLRAERRVWPPWTPDW